MTHLTRRSALGLAVGSALVGTDSAVAARPHRLHKHGTLPADAIRKITQLDGEVSSGILTLDVGRDDIGDVKGPMDVTFTSAFEIAGMLNFQPLGHHRAFLNGCLALKASEVNPVLDAVQANGLIFQAMHQHYIGQDPQVWFIHLRGVGAPTALAQAVRKVLAVTATPLPQKAPANPTSPLDHKRLGHILHGTAMVGDEGVVDVSVPRKDTIVIDNVVVDPDAGIAHSISFKPLDDSGGQVAAAPDFSLRADEVQRVLRTMRAAGFEVGCLYNQETSEHPQLYFAHMVAKGAPETLAGAIRRGIALTRSA